MDRDEVIIFPYSRKTKTVPEFVGKLDNNGGFTTVEVTNPNGVTTVGHAKCHNADIFNYRRGVEIALNRAMGS